jgi:hypothetical protein
MRQLCGRASPKAPVLQVCVTQRAISSESVSNDADTISPSESPKIVNWDVAAQRLSSSIGTIKEEVHEATR